MVQLAIPVVLAALWWFDVEPGPGVWGLLPGLVLLVAAGASLACFTLPASLVLYDLRYGLPVAQWALLAATPVFYERPSGGLLARVVDLNPLSAMVPPLRDWLLQAPSATAPVATLGAMAAIVVPLLALGLAYYGTRIRLAVAYVGR